MTRVFYNKINGLVFLFVLLLFTSLFLMANEDTNTLNSRNDQNTFLSVSEAPAGLQPVILTSQQSHYTFAGKLNYIDDKQSRLSFDQAQQALTGNGFKLMRKDNLSLGYIKSTLWLRFMVKDTADKPQKWLLQFDYPLLDDIEIYSRATHRATHGSHNEWSKQIMGDSQTFNQREVPHRAFVLQVKTPPGQSTEYIVRVRTTSSMQIRPSITSAETFFNNELAKEMFFGLVYGIMILMAIYNLFLYLAVKDLAYLTYVISVLSGGIFIMGLNGHAYQYLWPEYPSFANTVIPLSTSVWMTSTALFTQIFLETKKYAARFYVAINVLIGLTLFSIVFSLLGDYQTAIKMATGLALFNGLLILATSIACWRAGNRFARFFVVAWVFYGLGTAMLITSRFGVLADNFMTHNSATLGLIIEIIILSLALTDRYRVMADELASHALELENKVTLRTQELESSNLQLKKLSRYDFLTGLANRRYFELQLAKEWERSIRDGKKLSILVCDVDQFKNINDHFGHQYGDECLQSVASVLLDVLHRPADMPARYGGDEFVVILPETDAQGAIQLACRICQKMQKVGLTQAPDALHKMVTLSIGCATLTPTTDNDIKQLFSLADEGLFKAKEKGRNCVA